MKTALYATAGIPGFWLVSIPAPTIEVHRRPSAGRSTTIDRCGHGDTVAPAAHPALRIGVGDLFD